MSSPRELLPAVVQFDLLRYLSYSWKPSLIQDIIARRYGFRLTHNCIRAMKNNADCPPRCPESCWLRRDAYRIPKLVTPEELDPEFLKEERLRQAQYLLLDELPF